MLPSARHRHDVSLSDPRDKNKREKQEIKRRDKNKKDKQEKRMRYVGAEGNGNGYVEQKRLLHTR